MGLDDLFKHKYHHNSSHNHHGGHHHSHFKLELLRSVLRYLPHKKTLLVGALIICIVIFITGIALLWAIFPLITQAVGYVEANGIKSIVDTILPYVEKLWKGAGK
jgi:hypothetical protein